LVEGSSQITYGTTGSGGVNNLGVIYQLSLSGVFKVIKHLDGTTGRSSRGELVVVKGVSAITSNSVLEAEDINASKPASIYPNPVRGTLVLESNELEEDFVIQILNSSGQLIRQSSNNKRIGNNQVQLDVGDLQPGSYILTLKSKSK
jgi:uncharacterized repeat protein (TIGR03803 family)